MPKKGRVNWEVEAEVKPGQCPGHGKLRGPSRVAWLWGSNSNHVCLYALWNLSWDRDQQAWEMCAEEGTKGYREAGEGPLRIS